MLKRTHILASFDENLDKLRSELIEMGRLTRQNIELSVRGLLERNKEFCNQVVADDDLIDQHELAVDEISMETLLKYRPVATDLRMVLSTMSISRSLERMADHSVYIAKRSRKVADEQDRTDVQLIEPIFSGVDKIVEKALRCFIDSNLELAMELEDDYFVIKKAAKGLIKDFTQRIEQTNQHSQYYLHLIFIVRSLQRIAALSVNISEDAIFQESAESPRHR